MKQLITFFLILGCYATVALAELKDPTRPAAALQNAENGLQPLILNEIITNDHQVAVINGVVLRVGDEIEGNKVTKIDTNSVQLNGINDRITLFLTIPIKQAP